MDARTRAESKAARERAVAEGNATYVGYPCAKCGGTVRITESNYCVACTEAHRRKRLALRAERDAPLNEAIAAGSVTYIGHPCVRCGNTVRYASSAMCKPCKDVKSVAWQRANREKLNARMRERRRLAAQLTPVSNQPKEQLT